ncbi:hypothetical protein RRF57_008093 [Xylaria bambusicola]|uniref:Uncharacterized protein n=1 Tax=Xylaria bambusicola TaxID=326684 RepID=A0AAN7URH5_9PEZI
MLDPWDELETLQKGQRDSLICARDLESIKDSCIREHGKNHVVECSECWTRLINRLRDRYLNSPIKEWFSGRRAFLQELDDLFSKARQKEVDFKTIEDRIVNEKQEWFRDRVCNLVLHSGTKSPSEARALQQKLNDRDIPTSQLVLELRESLGADIEEIFKIFLNNVKTAQSPSSRNHAYIDALFQPELDPINASKSRKYIDMIRDGKPASEVINVMTRDRQSAKGDSDQKQELRRAKAAHELDKNKRDQLRQEKARAAMSSAANTLPPCSVCDTNINAQKFLACALCQLLSDYYKVLDRPTLFCSEACYEKDYDMHVAAMHECCSGLDCLNLSDPDSAMEVDEPLVVFCRECVENLGQGSVFCSSHCLDVNFHRHRDRVHFPERERTHHETYEEGQVAFDPEDESTYSAGDIKAEAISLRDAMLDWQQKTEARIS